LEWWKNKKSSFYTLEAGQDSLRQYYGDPYKPDRSYCQPMELRQTSTAQHYLTEVDRLNSYAAIPDRQLINFLINGINHISKKFWRPDALQVRPDAIGFAASSSGAGTFRVSGRH